MHCACSTASAEPCYGAPFYIRAGAAGRFAFYVSNEPTAPGRDLTGASVQLFIKGSITELDSAARLVATIGSGLTWIDQGLGALIWDITASTTFAAPAYVPGTPWIYILKITFADGAPYFPRGGTGEFWLEMSPAGSEGCGAQVAWAPFARGQAVGPNDSPEPLYATTAYVDNAIDSALADLLERGSAANDGSAATIVTAPAGARIYSADIVFTGAAGTRTVVAAVPDQVQRGDKLTLDYTLPATAGLVIELRNALETDAGALLDTLTTDASGDSACIELTYTGTVWEINSALYPSN